MSTTKPKHRLRGRVPSGERASKPCPPYRQPTFCNFVKNPTGTLLFCGFYGDARMARTACRPALLSAFPAKPLDSHRESARSKGNRKSGARFPQMGVPIPRFQDGNAGNKAEPWPPITRQGRHQPGLTTALRTRSRCEAARTATYRKHQVRIRCRNRPRRCAASGTCPAPNC